MSADEARDSLSRQQAALVAALSRRSDVPEGFDPDRVALAARTLDNKRRKGVARAWPGLAETLGDRFPATFGAFAGENPPHPDGPSADGYAFATWLDSRDELPPDAVAELLAAQLHRGFPFAFRIRRVGNHLVLGARLPLLGVRLFAPAGARR